ncbi:MAG: hypothetical protein AABY64_13780 [Bdellovibrionota bacterium]
MKFLFLILFVFQARAETPFEEHKNAEEAQAEAKNVLKKTERVEAELQQSLNKQNKTIEDYNKRIKEEKQIFEASAPAYSQKKGGFLGFFERDFDDDFTRDHQNRKAQIKRLEESRENEKERLKGLRNELGETQDDILYAKAHLRASDKTYEKTKEKLTDASLEIQKEMMDVSYLTLDHEIIGVKLSAVGLEVENLKRKYDTAMIGAYMRDRMKRLLSSRAFCASAKSCPNGIDANELNTLFDSNTIFPGFNKNEFDKKEEKHDEDLLRKGVK